jgi:hypothetical protein
VEPLAPVRIGDRDPGQRSDRPALEDPELFNHPWIYIVEGGQPAAEGAEVPILREYLLRGGTLTFDDFHGPIEWANVEMETEARVPDRKIVDLPKEHPIFTASTRCDGFPQTPGLGSFLQGRTWEKGGYDRRAARDRGRQRRARWC